MSDVLNNAETMSDIASDVVTGATLVQRVATLEASHAALQDAVTTPAATLPDGFDKAVALINEYGPMLEELAAVAHAAKRQGASFGSIFGAIGQQLLGIFLHPTVTADSGKVKIGGGAAPY